MPVRTVPLEIRFRHHAWAAGPTAATLQEAKAERSVQLRLWSIDGRPFTIAKINSSVPTVTGQAMGSSPGKVQAFKLTARPVSGPGRRLSQSGRIDVYFKEFPEEPYRLDLLVLPE